MTKLDEAIANLLSPDAYRQLEHAASLKGLLKPFKGNGDLILFAVSIQRLENQLTELMAAMLVLAAQPPVSLLDLRLTVQKTSADTQFLRWRSRDFNYMGTNVWKQAMEQPHVSQSVREALYQLEINRITLNLQMSSLHSAFRQAIEGAGKMLKAEIVLNPDPPSNVEYLP
ncbi:MAG: DUF3158 family protein [Pseudomonas sp.]